LDYLNTLSQLHRLHEAKRKEGRQNKSKIDKKEMGEELKVETRQEKRRYFMKAKNIRDNRHLIFRCRHNKLLAGDSSSIVI
jgi:hypothetical protein